MAEKVLEVAQAAVSARGVARLAISGGSTPKRSFELLADPEQGFVKQMPWDKIDLFWVDERCVPPDDKDSNYRMTREALLSKVPLPQERVFRIEGELDPEDAAARYESAIRNRFRLEGAELPTFDLVALGMGPDGHTASLFPHTEGLHELGRVAIANHVPQKETWRVTLTAPVINQGRQVVFLIGGEDKAEVLSQVLSSKYDPETWPSQLVQPKNGSLLLLLDRAAAALLPKTDESGEGHLEIQR
ncbi:6-phosphogluconolactonase [Acidisarcina polymorpha]|uniref:6-phosphogluconolactonase n=2 Tax=Acidisarcina polymorpha TaxID=2211140 RepID=A0A2Z5G7F1_9BACT|nr:6-phosphogluconolactonase [Acidisarcina polymorpha]